MKLFRKFEVKIRYAIYALKQINRPHLGDIVVYEGKEHALIQGMNSPMWDLMCLDKENLKRPKRKIEKNVHEANFKLQPLYKRFVYSFMFSYKFQMNSWYLIDINKKGKISYNKNYKKTTNQKLKRKILIEKNRL